VKEKSPNESETKPLPHSEPTPQESNHPTPTIDRTKPSNLDIVIKPKEEDNQGKNKSETLPNKNDDENAEIWEEYEQDQAEMMEAWDEMLAEREQEKKLQNGQTEIPIINEIIGEDSPTIKNQNDNVIAKEDVATTKEEASNSETSAFKKEPKPPTETPEIDKEEISEAVKYLRNIGKYK
jgi:hypothetical protein